MKDVKIILFSLIVSSSNLFYSSTSKSKRFQSLAPSLAPLVKSDSKDSLSDFEEEKIGSQEKRDLSRALSALASEVMFSGDNKELFLQVCKKAAKFKKDHLSALKRNDIHADKGAEGNMFDEMIIDPLKRIQGEQSWFDVTVPDSVLEQIVSAPGLSSERETVAVAPTPVSFFGSPTSCSSPEFGKFFYYQLKRPIPIDTKGIPEIGKVSAQFDQRFISPIKSSKPDIRQVNSPSGSSASSE